MNKVSGNLFKSSMVSLWMNSLKSGLFTTRTVNELLWGYQDPLLTKVSATNPDVEKVFGLMYKVCATSWTKECSVYFCPISKSNTQTSGSL